MICWGLCGGSGSGKTTLAASMAQALAPDAEVVAIDSYYRDLTHLDPAARDAVDFDAPDSIEAELLVAHLDQLSTGVSVELPIYDFPTHTRAGSDPLHPSPHLIVEGILLLALPGLADRLDHVIFLDAPDEVRFQRRLTRDIEDRGRDEDEVTGRWNRNVRPGYLLHVAPHRHRADLVVPFGGSVADNTAAVLSYAETPPQP